MFLISAGHHATAQGACFEGFCEHPEAQIWASKIVNLLGHDAMLVPSGVLKSKVSFINSQQHPVAAVEIHFNSAVVDGEHVGKGSETLYYPGGTKSKQLAELVQERLKYPFGPDRGVKEGWYRMQQKFGPDFFLARTICPSVIIEPDFIHRKEQIESNRDWGCTMIASALEEFKKRIV